MRWIWVDRFIEFESGRRARAVKCVSLAEEHLYDHYPGNPMMPASLMLEGMAQTGGTLLGEMHGFARLVFLAKVPRLEIHDVVCPGDQVTYTATVQDAREEGGTTLVQAHVGEKLVAEAEIMFAQLSPSDSTIPVSARQLEFVRSIMGAALPRS